MMESPDGDSTLFVYGSLLDPAHRGDILGRLVDTMPAVLEGYERGRGRHYFICGRPGGVTSGLLLLNLTRRDFDVLDEYEEVPSLYTRERIEVSIENGAGVRCWVYLPTARLIAG
jgi:gamma-glutamylcyclotransferase (GGCT)/AIG2-like uncharacterized protein YtfP